MFINIFEIGCKIMLNSKRFIIFLLKAFYVHFYNIDVKSSIHDDATFFIIMIYKIKLIILII